MPTRVHRILIAAVLAASGCTGMAEEPDAGPSAMAGGGSAMAAGGGAANPTGGGGGSVATGGGGSVAAGGGSVATGGGSVAAGGGTTQPATGGGTGNTPWSCNAKAAPTATPAGQWKNVTANLAGMASECGNVSFLSAKPDMDMIITDVAQHGLWASTNGGVSWSALGLGSGSATITNRMSMIKYDPAHPSTWWESGIYNSGGVYRTDDNGQTFVQLGNTTHDDSVSIDFTDPDRKTLVAGGHEQEGRFMLSTDKGQTWTDIGAKLPAHSGFSSQAVAIDSHTFLLGSTLSYGDQTGTPGIFRSTDTGQTWTRVSPKFAATGALVASDGAIYWPLNNTAWYDDGGLARSTDHGLTWTVVTPPGTIAVHTPIELPDGRLVAIGPQTLMISGDCGMTWHALSTQLPTQALVLTYSTFQKAFFVSYFTCDNNVPADALSRYDWDYTAN